MTTPTLARTTTRAAHSQYGSTYDPHAAGRLVLLLAVTAMLQFPSESPERAVALVADDVRVAIGQEGAAASRRAGRDAFAQEQVAFAVAEMMTVLEIAEPLAVDELRSLQRSEAPLRNPSTPEGQAALYAWIGHLAGAVGGSILGVLVGSLAAASGAVGAGVALTGLGAYIGGAVGSRYAVARAPKIPASELRETKNYATFGSLLMPWFGLGAALGGYLGPSPNPTGDSSAARTALLSTDWPRELVAAWGKTGITAGAMADSVIDTAHAAGWTDEQIIADPRGAMREANEIWETKPIETGWGEFPEYIENPRKWNPQPVTIRVSMRGGSTRDVAAEQVTPHLVVHPSVRTGSEVELAAQGDASSWGVTHGPTGALVATLGDEKWAKKLAKEIEKASGPGIGTRDVEQAQRVIGGPHMRRAQYIGHVSRQSAEPKQHRGKFPTFRKWSETAHELDENPANPESLKADAAIAAAVGSIVGSIAGVVLGAVVLGGVGALAGAAAFGAEAGTGGGIVGAVYGIPLGAFIGSIWGAVRQTGKVVTGPDAASAKLGAGIGGAFGAIPAGIGAYIGAPA